jgi:hypothetical protein
VNYRKIMHTLAFCGQGRRRSRKGKLNCNTAKSISHCSNVYRYTYVNRSLKCRVDQGENTLADEITNMHQVIRKISMTDLGHVNLKTFRDFILKSEKVSIPVYSFFL